MFKSLKARVRSSSAQLKNGSIHGLDKLDKLTKSNGKRNTSGSAASIFSNGKNGHSKEHKEHKEHKDIIEEQRSVSAPGSSRPGNQARFGCDRKNGRKEPFRPPPIGGGADLSYSPVASNKSVPINTQHGSQEIGNSQNNNSSMMNSSGGVYYVYDESAYDGKDTDFNIFAKPDGITPKSSRLVIQCLTSAFKETIPRVGDSKTLQQVMKPNLHHFSKEEVQEVKRLICGLFPHDGCSLKDQALRKFINESFGDNVIRLAVALRIIWSSFSNGIIPWESYYKFTKWESQTGYPPESFHFRFSKFLPDRDYTFCTFAFLEFLLCILLQKNKLMLDKGIQMDLIFTAGATAFVREPSYCSPANEEIPPVIRSYYQRGNALHRLFVGYIRSLNHERKLGDFYLLDIFQIEQYPPRSYKARSAKALTLTIPKGNPDGNDFTSLISQAASAKKRFYSSSSSFSRIENAFLDQFEEQTLRVIMNFFSESSNRYITTFDDGFDADFLQGASKPNKSHTRKISDDDNMVSTWLQMAKEQNGFDELLEVLENNHVPEGGTLALGVPAATTMGPMFRKDRNEDPNSSVRIGKTNITEWMINSWKYEMFMGRVQNTLLIKLTKKVDECNWLVLSCEENVNMNPLAVLPPAKHPPIPKDRPKRFQQKSAAMPLPSVREFETDELPSLPDIPIPKSISELIADAESDPEPKQAPETTDEPVSELKESFEATNESKPEPTSESKQLPEITDEPVSGPKEAFDALNEPRPLATSESKQAPEVTSESKPEPVPESKQVSEIANEPVPESKQEAPDVIVELVPEPEQIPETTNEPMVEPTSEPKQAPEDTNEPVPKPTETPKVITELVSEPTPLLAPEPKRSASEKSTQSTNSSIRSDDPLIEKLNNVDVSSSAEDISYERDSSRATRNSHNVLGDLLESCYTGSEVEAN